LRLGSRQSSRPQSMGKPKARRKPWGLLALALVCAGAVGFWLLHTRTQVTVTERPIKLAGSGAFTDSLTARLPDVLSELGVRKAWIRCLPQDQTKPNDILQIRVRVPKDLPLTLCNLEITRLVRRLGGRVLRAEADRLDERVSIHAGTDDKASVHLYLVADPSLVRKTGRIALIVEDFGSGSLSLAEEFCALRQRVTLSVLPVSQKCRRVVDLARSSGHDALLHMPMEPLDYPENDPGENAILVRDSRADIHRKIRAALRCVGPGVQGVSNHMGSRATVDRPLMETVMEELKRRGLFFVDSRTSSQSLAFEAAWQKGLKTGRNSLFY